MNAAYWRELTAKAAAARREARTAKTSAAAKVHAIRFCVDCAHHSFERDRDSRRIRHLCACPALLNPVTGEPTDPAMNRVNAILCSREARFFAEKIAAPAPVAQPAAPDDSEPAEYVPPVEILPACIRRRRRSMVAA